MVVCDLDATRHDARLRAHHLRDAKVGEHELVVSVDEDVLRLDVLDDEGGPHLVKLSQSAEERVAVPPHDPRIERAGRGHDHVEKAALVLLHHDAHALLLFARAMQHAHAVAVLRGVHVRAQLTVEGPSFVLARQRR